MELIETAVFTRQAREILFEEDLRMLQLYLLARPDAGVVIPGSGGLGKLRWGLPGRGRRGGARLIYMWQPAAHRIFLVFLYPKNVTADLSTRQLLVLRKLISEPKTPEK